MVSGRALCHIPCPNRPIKIVVTGIRAPCVPCKTRAGNSVPHMHHVKVGHGIPRTMWSMKYAGMDIRAPYEPCKTWAWNPVHHVKRGHGYPVPIRTATVCAPGAPNAGLPLVGTVCIVQNSTHPPYFLVFIFTIIRFVEHFVVRCRRISFHWMERLCNILKTIQSIPGAAFWFLFFQVVMYSKRSKGAISNSL